MRQFAVFALLAMLVSCTGNMVYDTYHIIDVDGWRQKDTLVFPVSDISEDGIYQSMLGLRITNCFPYSSLSVDVEQTIYPLDTATGKRLPEASRTTTVKCRFFDKDGNLDGVGVGRFQYEFPVDSMKLFYGDSLVVRVSHIMNKDSIPCISEIGYVLKKLDDLDSQENGN